MPTRPMEKRNGKANLNNVLRKTIILGHRTAGRDHDFARLKELGLM